MKELTLLWIIILGCAGGLVPEMIRYVNNFKTVTEEQYFKKSGYVLNVIFLAILGGIGAVISGQTDVTGVLLAGFTAPELISRLGGGLLDRLAPIKEDEEEPTKVPVDKNRTEEINLDAELGNEKVKSKFNLSYWWKQ